MRCVYRLIDCFRSKQLLKFHFQWLLFFQSVDKTPLYFTKYLSAGFFWKAYTCSTINMAHFQVWEDRTSLGKFCGTTIPYPRLSTGSSLTVVFITDYQTEKSGFKMFYSQQHSTCVV